MFRWLTHADRLKGKNKKKTFGKKGFRRSEREEKSIKFASNIYA